MNVQLKPDVAFSPSVPQKWIYIQIGSVQICGQYSSVSVNVVGAGLFENPQSDGFDLWREAQCQADVRTHAQRRSF